jgi:hypothetical protein
MTQAVRAAGVQAAPAVQPPAKPEPAAVGGARALRR